MKTDKEEMYKKVHEYVLLHRHNMKSFDGVKTLSKKLTDFFIKTQEADKEGLLKEEFKVGKWYKWDKTEKTDVLFYATELTDYPAIYGYGFGGKGVWSDETFFYRNPNNYNDALTHLIPATDQEVEEALIKEAKKRGYKSGNYECLKGSTFTHNDDYEYDRGELFTGFINDQRNIIFSNGKWAEIVEETISDNKPLKEATEAWSTFKESLDNQKQYKGLEMITAGFKKLMESNSDKYNLNTTLCKLAETTPFSLKTLEKWYKQAGSIEILEKAIKESQKRGFSIERIIKFWNDYDENKDKMTYVSESKPNVSTSWCWYKQAGEVIKNSVQAIKDYEKLNKVLDGTEDRMKATQKAARGLNQAKYPSGGLTDKEAKELTNFINDGRFLENLSSGGADDGLVKENELIRDLFIGKMSREIGLTKTMKLLKESKEAFKK